MSSRIKKLNKKITDIVSSRQSGIDEKQNIKIELWSSEKNLPHLKSEHKFTANILVFDRTNKNQNVLTAPQLSIEYALTDDEVILVEKFSANSKKSVDLSEIAVPINDFLDTHIKAKIPNESRQKPRNTPFDTIYS